MPCWQSSTENSTQQKKLARLRHTTLQVPTDLTAKPTSSQPLLRCPYVVTTWAFVTASKALHHLWIDLLSMLSILGSGEDPPAKTPSTPHYMITTNHCATSSFSNSI